MKPQKLMNNPPVNIKICIVNAMRVLRLILIQTHNLQHFFKWAEAIKVYLNNLSGNTFHVVPDYSSSGDEKIIRKNQSEYIINKIYIQQF